MMRFLGSNGYWSEVFLPVDGTTAYIVKKLHIDDLSYERGILKLQAPYIA